MKDFFKTYPDAKPVFKVGERYFLHTAKEQAVICAAESGLKIEELKGGEKIEVVEEVKNTKSKSTKK